MQATPAQLYEFGDFRAQHGETALAAAGWDDGAPHSESVRNAPLHGGASRYRPRQGTADGSGVARFHRRGEQFEPEHLDSAAYFWRNTGLTQLYRDGSGSWLSLRC